MNKYFFDFSLDDVTLNRKVNHIIDDSLQNTEKNEHFHEYLSESFFSQSFLDFLKSNFHKGGFSFTDFEMLEIVGFKIDSTLPVDHLFAFHRESVNYDFPVAAQTLFLLRSPEVKGGDLIFMDKKIPFYPGTGVVHSGFEKKCFTSLSGRGYFLYLNVVASIKSMRENETPLQ